MSATVSLFYPEMSVQIGAYTINQNVEMETCSSCDSYYDWCRVKLQPELRSQMTIKKNDSGAVFLGYDGNLQAVFSGSVVNASVAGHEILMKDDMLKLERTKITCTFLDAGPVEIISYCLQQAGIPQFKVFADTFPKKLSVAFREKTIIQVLEDVKSIWGIKDLFYFVGGVLYFGQQPPQNKIYTLEYGESIISLEKEKAVWVVETASVPFIHHSDAIKINHPDIADGPKEVRVKKVIFKTNAAGFVRTRIYF